MKVCARLVFAGLSAAVLAVAGPAVAQDKKEPVPPKGDVKPVQPKKDQPPVPPHRLPGQPVPKEAPGADLPEGTHQMVIYNGEIPTYHYFPRAGADVVTLDALAQREREENEAAEIRLVARQSAPYSPAEGVGSELVTSFAPRLGIAVNNPVFPYPWAPFPFAPYAGAPFYGAGLAGFGPGLGFGAGVPYAGGYGGATAGLVFVNRPLGTALAAAGPGPLSPGQLSQVGPGREPVSPVADTAFRPGEPVTITRKGGQKTEGTFLRAGDVWLVIRGRPGGERMMIRMSEIESITSQEGVKPAVNR